jgi:UDP-glucose 4-epimerase
MRYLVTGGAGFIGSHLVDALVSAQQDVIVLDDLSTGSESNLGGVPPGAIRLVHGSVLDGVTVDELVAQADVVIHLAAAVGVRLIVTRPLESFISNIKGAENVLDSAHGHGRKVLLASTSEIYGKSTEAPFREDGDRTLGHPRVWRWAYSTAKSVDEILAHGYSQERGLATVVVRLFNTVGPRQTGSYGMVLPTLVSQALAGEPLTVYGDGTQTRCFCHVKDVVAALMTLAVDPRAEGEVFNVGSTEEVTILELAKRVIEMTGSSSKIVLVPYEEAYAEGYEDMARRVPDISKIGDLIGWRPRRTLDETISDVIEGAPAAAGEPVRAGTGATSGDTRSAWRT